MSLSFSCSCQSLQALIVPIPASRIRVTRQVDRHACLLHHIRGQTRAPRLPALCHRGARLICRLLKVTVRCLVSSPVMLRISSAIPTPDFGASARPDACSGGCTEDQVCAIAEPVPSSVSSSQAQPAHICVSKADYPRREIATRFANPRIDGYGYQAITVNPNPAVVYQNTHIDVSIGNSGANNAFGITVDLAFNDWGLSFNGWQPIGSQVTLFTFTLRCLVT